MERKEVKGQQEQAWAERDKCRRLGEQLAQDRLALARLREELAVKGEGIQEIEEQYQLLRAENSHIAGQLEAGAKELCGLRLERDRLGFVLQEK